MGRVALPRGYRIAGLGLLLRAGVSGGTIVWLVWRGMGKLPLNFHRSIATLTHILQWGFARMGHRFGSNHRVRKLCRHAASRGLMVDPMRVRRSKTSPCSTPGSPMKSRVVSPAPFVSVFSRIRLWILVAGRACLSLRRFGQCPRPIAEQLTTSEARLPKRATTLTPLIKISRRPTRWHPRTRCIALPTIAFDLLMRRCM